MLSEEEKDNVAAIVKDQIQDEVEAIHDKIKVHLASHNQLSTRLKNLAERLEKLELKGVPKS